MANPNDEILKRIANDIADVPTITNTEWTEESQEEFDRHARAIAARFAIEYEVPLDVTKAMVRLAMLACLYKDSQEGDLGAADLAASSYLGAWEILAPALGINEIKLTRAAGSILLAINKL